ncbi:MAG: hypothetical protein WD181_01080 [Solirubrobacterales bacterium]
MSVEIDLMPDPVRRGLATSGPIGCVQSALITVEDDLFEQLWTPPTLELLARAYWSFIRKRSFGLIRMGYEPGSRSVNLISKRIPLLRFHEPEFESGTDHGWVKWPIDRGLLVAAEGRGNGYLKIEARRDPERSTRPGFQAMTVTSEVMNFYPWLRGSGWFSRMGTWIYSQTELRIHLWVTRGYMRSLADLPASVIRQGTDPGAHSGED